MLVTPLLSPLGHCSHKSTRDAPRYITIQLKIFFYTAPNKPDRRCHYFSRRRNGKCFCWLQVKERVCDLLASLCVTSGWVRRLPTIHPLTRIMQSCGRHLSHWTMHPDAQFFWRNSSLSNNDRARGYSCVVNRFLAVISILCVYMCPVKLWKNNTCQQTHACEEMRSAVARAAWDFTPITSADIFPTQKIAIQLQIFCRLSLRECVDDYFHSLP